MIYRGLAFDRSEADVSAFFNAQKVERQYFRHLKKLSDYISSLVAGFDLEDIEQLDRLASTLERYGTTIVPHWAEAVGKRMVLEVNARDDKGWKSLSSQMSQSLKKQLADAPIGRVMRSRLDEQVRLITSLPTESAQRVRKLTLEALTSGRRSEDIAKELAATGEVALSRAKTIARTEVGRTSTELLRTKAEYIGSPGYFWRTAKDAEVRPSHRAMQDKFVAWNDPPTLDGMTGHAGCFPNCRCRPRLAMPT